MTIKKFKKEVKDFFNKKSKIYNELRNFRANSEKQFKIEKWLQAELLFFLRNKSYDAIPEFNKKKRDICIVDKNNRSNKFYIQLKDYFGSNQKFSSDSKGVIKDIRSIKGSKNAVLLLVLPCNITCDYYDKMNKYIRRQTSLEQKKNNINNIQFLIIYRKSHFKL